MIRHAIVCVLALPGCFRPAYDHTACSTEGTCPPGLSCNASGVCEPPGSIASTDAAIDSPGTVPVDARPGAFCVGTFTRACVDVTPTADVNLTSQTINTDQTGVCASATLTPPILACVISGRSITIPSGNTVTVVGSKPLILLADTITISGTLDVASHRGKPGAGVSSSGCGSSVILPTTGGGRMDGGGGFGGSNGGKGGAGGEGGEDGQAGGPPDALPLTVLRGGCDGSFGAGASSVGGNGGGAVALNAKTSLSIDGVVNASGASGAGGKTSGGGGGGGSGGMIVLDAPTVSVTGQCFANGGGGGEGANGVANGEDGHESLGAGTSGAGGSIGTSVGGDGGAGSVGSVLGGAFGVRGSDEGGAAVGGGGGGGGGAGVIHVISTNPSGTTDPAKVSPPPS